MQRKKTVANAVRILWGCLLAFFVVATPAARGAANPDLAEDVTLTPHQPVYQRSFDFAAGEPGPRYRRASWGHRFAPPTCH